MELKMWTESRFETCICDTQKNLTRKVCLGLRSELIGDFNLDADAIMSWFLTTDMKRRVPGGGGGFTQLKVGY